MNTTQNTKGNTMNIERPISHIGHAADAPCSSVSVEGHNFVDTGTPAYESMGGERRVWQRCTGCGNVHNRPAPLVDHYGDEADATLWVVFWTVHYPDSAVVTTRLAAHPTRTDAENHVMECYGDALDSTFTVVEFAPIPF